MERETTIWYFGLTWGEQSKVWQWLRAHKPPRDWSWGAMDYAFLTMPELRTPAAEAHLSQAVLKRKFQIGS